MDLRRLTIRFLLLAFAGLSSADRAAAVDRPVLVPQLGHAGHVASAALSPDRRFIVTGGRDGTVRLWHFETLEELQILAEPRTGQFQHAVAEFSRDSRRIVYSSGQHIGVFDLEQKNILWAKTLAKVVNGRPGFSPDGSQIFVCSGTTDVSIDVLNVATGRIDDTIDVRNSRLDGYGSPVCAWSNDGRSAAVGFSVDSKSFGIWDLKKGTLIGRYEGVERGIRSLQFSPSSRKILAVDRSRRALIWDVGHFQSPMQVEIPSPSIVADAIFVGDDDSLALIQPAADSSVQQLTNRSFAARLLRWDLKTRQVTNGAETQATYPHLPMSYSDGILLAGHGTYVDVWQVDSWSRAGTLSNSNLGTIESIEATEDERFLLVVFRGDPRKPLGYVIDLERGEIVRETTADDGRRFVLDPNGKFVIEGRQTVDLRTGAILNSDLRWIRPVGHVRKDGLVPALDVGSLILIDPITGKRYWEWQLPKDEHGRFLNIQTVAVSPDHELVATSDEDRNVQLWETRSRRVKRLLPGNGIVRALEFSSDGTRLLVVRYGVALWDVDSEQARHQFTDRDGVVTSARFIPGDRQIAITTYDGRVLLWDPETGATALQYTRHTGSATAALVLERRSIVVSGGSDKVLRFSDRKGARDPLLLAIRSTSQWAVIDTAGRFDSAPEARDAFVWVVGYEPIELDQLKSRYYEPHLLAKFLANDGHPLRDVSIFAPPDLFPLVETSGPTAEDPRIHIVLTDRGGGIGEVPVYLNGQEFTPNARDLPENRNAREIDGKLRLSVDVQGDQRLKAENRVTVFAFERDNYLRSRSKGVTIRSVVKSDTKPTVLHAVVVGVSDYEGTKIDLDYAGKDAVDFARSLEIAAGRMLGKERTKIKILSTAINDRAQWPYKKTIEHALTDLLGASQADIVVVYFSGHGVSFGNEKGDYYFLTANASSTGMADSEIRRKVAFSGNELADILKRIPAQKRVVLLDTCSSGSFVQIFGTSRFPPDDQERALKTLQERTGFHILAGSAADQPSWEASPYAQGLLTYCLLLGMSGDAHDRDGYVNVLKLFNVAETRVPILAAGIKGIQKPLHASPDGGTDFPIGRVLSDDAPSIPIQLKRPVFVRTNFQDAAQFRDHLRLSKLLNQRLDSAAAPDAEGRSCLIYVDDDEYPNALQIVGRYAIENDRLTVEGIVYRGDGDSFPISVVGDRADPAAVADQVMQAVFAKVQEGLCNQN